MSTKFKDYSKLYGTQVIVYWVDACKDNVHPYRLEDVPNVDENPILAITPGFLVRVSDDWVSLAEEFFVNDNTYRNRTDIPRKWVVDIYKIIQGPKIKL